MRRRFLNAASILCCVACVALMGMWVRSYWWSDHFSGRVAETRVFSVVLELGRALWRFESGRTPLRLEPLPPYESRPGWAWTTTSYPIGSFEIPGVHGGRSTRFGFVIKSVAVSMQETISSLALPYFFASAVSFSRLPLRVSAPLRETFRRSSIIDSLRLSTHPPHQDELRGDFSQDNRSRLRHHGARSAPVAP